MEEKTRTSHQNSYELTVRREHIEEGRKKLMKGTTKPFGNNTCFVMHLMNGSKEESESKKMENEREIKVRNESE